MLRDVTLAFSTFHLALAAYVNHPLHSQHSVIARVGQPYAWTIPPASFSADVPSNELAFTIPDLPSWLHFDSKTFAFSGTPSSVDVGSATIRVQVSELGEPSAFDSFKLIVSDKPAPTINIPLSSQIIPSNPHISSAFVDQGKPANEIPTLSVPPAWSFSIGLEGSTIESPTGEKIFYAAALADGSPLPQWLMFNEKWLTFGGVTPVLEKGDQDRFEILLFGSEVKGYCSVQDRFILFVTNDVGTSRGKVDNMEVMTRLLPVNVTAETPFSFDFDNFNFQDITLDGQNLLRENISEIIVETSSFPWLTFDATTSRLSGIPPRELLDSSSTLLPLHITLKGDDSPEILTNVSLVVLPSLFTTMNLPPLLARPSSQLSFDLDQFFANISSTNLESDGTLQPLDISATYNPRDAGSWITFDNGSHTLSGIVPSSLTYSNLEITFHATSPVTNATSTTSLLVNLSTPPSSLPDARHKGGLSHRSKIAVGATLGTVGGIILLCCLLAACRLWCTEREGKGVYVIDHGPYGDRTAGAWALSEETVKNLSQTSNIVEEKDADGFSVVHLGGGASSIGANPKSWGTSAYSNVTNLPNLRVPAPPSAHVSEGKMQKGRFFGKLKGRVSGLPGSSPDGKKPGSDKENRIPRDGLSSSLKSLLRVGQSSSSLKSRPVISRPMPMPTGSAHSALGIGMRTGTSPPSTPSNGSRSILRKPSFEDRIPIDPTGRFSSQTIPSARSLSALGIAPTAPKAKVAVTIGDGQGRNSNETLEGGIDQTSWAEEPSFAWASGKMVKTPLFKGVNESGPSESLDSLVPKRRKDFNPVPHPTAESTRHPAGRVNIEPTGFEPSISGRNLDQSLLLAHESSLSDLSDNRLSVASFASNYPAEGDTSESVIISTANRQHVVGVATPKRSIRSLHKAGRDGPSHGADESQIGIGFEDVTGRSDKSSAYSAGNGGLASNPRLMQFDHERKAAGASHGQRSVSHQAVVASQSGGVRRAGGTVDKQRDLEVLDQLDEGLHYVRTFGMDAEVNSQPENHPYPNHRPIGSILSTSMSSSSNESGRSRSLYPGATSHRSARTPSSQHPYAQSKLAINEFNASQHHPSSYGSDTAYHSRQSTHRILVTAGQPFNFSLPVFSGILLEKGRDTQLQISREDGTQLPGWLRFDSKELEFWGAPPEDSNAEGEQHLGVSVWQGQNCVAVFVVEVVGR